MSDEDEKVDGPKVAAKILGAMDEGRRKRIETQLSKREPGLAKEILSHLMTFEDLANLTEKSFPVLIAAIEQKDLVVAMKKCPSGLKVQFLRAMSERRRKAVEDDLAHLPQQTEQSIEEAKKRILEVVDQLRSHGKIFSRDPNDVWV